MKLLVSVDDLVGSRLFLLALKELYRWIWIHFFFRLKTGCFGWLGSKILRKEKAALESLSQKREIFFFFSKLYQVGGTMGAAI